MRFLYLTLLIVAFLPQNLAAQTRCFDYTQARKNLERTFNERIFIRGFIKDSEYKVEIFISESGSWSVVLINKDGSMCPIAGGDSLEFPDEGVLTDDPDL